MDLLPISLSARYHACGNVEAFQAKLGYSVKPEIFPPYLRQNNLRYSFITGLSSDSRGRAVTSAVQDL